MTPLPFYDPCSHFRHSLSHLWHTQKNIQGQNYCHSALRQPQPTRQPPCCVILSFFHRPPPSPPCQPIGIKKSYSSKLFYKQFCKPFVYIYDSSLTPEKVIKLQVVSEALYELPTLLVLCSGLELIWSNRLEKKSTRMYDIRAELECLVMALTKSRPRKLREASSMIKNTLEKFQLIDVVL